MSSNNTENNNSAIPNSNATATISKITKLNPSHVAKAKLLRQKLREKKQKEESMINSTIQSIGKSPEPSSPINNKDSSSNNIAIVKPEEEKIDPLKFVFSVENENYHANENNPISSNNIEKEKNEMKKEKGNENDNYENNRNNGTNMKKESNANNENIPNSMNNNNSMNKLASLTSVNNINSGNKVMNVNVENDVKVNNGIHKEKKDEIIDVKEKIENINGGVVDENKIQEKIIVEEKHNNIPEKIMIQKSGNQNDVNKNEKEDTNLFENKDNIEKTNGQIETDKKDNDKIPDELHEAKELNKEILQKKEKEEDKKVEDKNIISEPNIQPINNDIKSPSVACKQSPISNTEKPEEKNSQNSIPIPPQIPKNEKKEPVKQYKLPKIVKQRDSLFSSSSSDDDDDFSKKEEERLKNLKFAQQNLFKKANIIPQKNFLAAKKKDPELTKEELLQNLFLNFDETSELLELDDRKKQIMLKKMRRTLHRLSNLKPKNINPEEEEKRNLIRKKIEDLKNMTGNDYEKIKDDVEKIVLNLKLPDFYFDDDDDVERISDKEQNVELDFKPILEADFISFMRQ